MIHMNEPASDEDDDDVDDGGGDDDDGQSVMNSGMLLFLIHFKCRVL